ncbi:MAG: SPFH domain-containing protein [Lachnospiraceae bacterium]|nr:SPFH domain-containing protein [Lachnospiraceae bacterium]
MGLIKAAFGAAGGTLADQWKEFFYCDSISKEVLVVKGQKRTSGRSSNTKGNDNIITNGSGIAVADGQCMMIVEQGKVVEICAEPGEFTFDSSTEPTVFSGDLGDSIVETLRVMGKRFTYGGDTGKDQRVYYFNTKEIMDNKFGTANPIPFRVLDSKVNLDLDTAVRCSGVYSYKIVDPIRFYTNVCANVSDEFRRDEIESQLKTEFVDALQPAFGELSNLEIRPNQIVSHNKELKNAINEALKEDWYENRGLEIMSIAIGSVSLPEEDQEYIKQAQRARAFSDPGMGAGLGAIAGADGIKAAASNESGAMNGFVGMGMAMNANQATNAANANLYAMNQQNQQMQMQQQQMQQQQMQQQAAPAGNTWTCSCGTQVSGNFCPNCGTKKPEPAPAGNTWTCSCGTQVTGNFCPNCGSKKPEAAGQWTCSCGTVNTGKFCSNCGSPRQ